MTEPPQSCTAIAAAVQSHEMTARSVADAALARAAELQEKWHAFIALTPELARRQAEQIDQLAGTGKRLPLAGVPFAVKDVIDVEGVATTCGSPAFRDRVAGKHATVVRKLLAAGAVLLGKLNMHECAFGFTGENPTFGDCRNPWNPERIPGGSSSGSAVAVAVGICPLTLGTDTGGSIRLPAALCGVIGLKPTYGRISRSGVVPLAWSMDHVGPLVRMAEDAALVLEVLAGRDPGDPSSSRRAVPRFREELAKPLAGLRIGVPRRWFLEAATRPVAEAIEAAITRLAAAGARRVEVELPHLDEALGAHRAIIFSEAGSYHRPFLADRADLYSPDIRVLLEGGLVIPAVDYLHAQRVRRIVQSAWSEVFRHVDCLVTPAVPMVAPRFGQSEAELPTDSRPLVRACLDLTLPFNLSGHPALGVPCGFADGLPIGMQLVGRPFDEALLLRVARQYQRQTDWHERLPENG